VWSLRWLLGGLSVICQVSGLFAHGAVQMLVQFASNSFRWYFNQQASAWKRVKNVSLILRGRASMWTRIVAAARHRDSLESAILISLGIVRLNPELYLGKLAKILLEGLRMLDINYKAFTSLVGLSS
jgi:hypothetical protein